MCALELTERFGHARAGDGLTVAGGAPLDAATRVVDTAERRSAVTALLGLVTVAGPTLLSPADGEEGLTGDDDGVGEAADALGHLAATVRTDGHDPPLFDPFSRSSQSAVTRARMPTRSGVFRSTRVAVRTGDEFAGARHVRHVEQVADRHPEHLDRFESADRRGACGAVQRTELAEGVSR